MTSELKVFENPTFGQVRTVEIDNEPWFVGKDVAEALGYRDTSDALKKHKVIPIIRDLLEKEAS